MVCSSYFMEIISYISLRILIKFTFEFSSVSLSFLWVFSFVLFCFLFCLVRFGLCPYNSLMILGSLFISKSQTVESWLKLLGAWVAYDHWQASYRQVRRWAGIFTEEPQISVTLLTLFTLRYLEFMTLPETSVRQIGLFLINTKFAFCLLCEVIYHLPSTFSIHTLW